MKTKILSFAVFAVMFFIFTASLHSYPKFAAYTGEKCQSCHVNPTGGGIIYVENGALKYRGSSGTITTIANA